MQSNWNIIVVVICLLLAFFALRQELRRANRAYLIIRVMAVILAVVSLACIALPLSYKSRLNIAGTNDIILLTDGFNADSFKNTGRVKVFAIDEVIKKKYPQATLLNSLAGLDSLGTTSRINVYGYGLSSGDLRQLNNLPLVFHPAHMPAGITRVSWNGKLKAGEALHVQGTYNNLSAEKVKLVLKGLNTIADTFTVKPETQAQFFLTSLPKVNGRFVYMLQAIISNDTLNEGSLPVQVKAVEPLKVLMLPASPDFETRFLKNWLSQNGYAMVLRSPISKNKFSTEFINMPQFAVGQLTSTVLNKFDVVIGDLSVFASLNTSENAVLKQQVNTGLGIIVNADSSGKASWLQQHFPVDRPSGKEPAPDVLMIDGVKSRSKLITSQAHITYRSGTQPVVTGNENRVLVSSALSGAGKVIFTTIDNTFNWMLAGNKADYSAYWSALITKAAKKSPVADTLITSTQTPYVIEPVELQVSGVKTFPFTINGEDVPAVQDLNVPFIYTSTYWPAANGWQSFGKKGLAWWFAFAGEEWKGVHAAEKLAVTKKYAALHEFTGNVTKQIQETVRINVPKIYFYILLLAACTFLWIENKLS